MLKQKGQIILLLILVMTVALAIGLSIVQKSLVDVSTASKVEQSSRAFSAAEAGIEKALKGDTNIHQSFAGNSSNIKEVVDTGLIPPYPPTDPPTRQDPLAIPPLAKEDVVQIWLADFNSTANPPDSVYIQNTLDVYWGNSSTDKAAIELTLVYYDSTAKIYTAKKWYLDNANASRSPANGFKTVTCGGNYTLPGYQCYVRIGDQILDPYYNTSGYGALPSGLMLIRARLLYNTTSQPLAVHAVGVCGKPCSLPPQARIIVSTGVSGETQRRVKIFQSSKVVPPFFDYAIFSAGDISK